jgi:hypothetical protein
VRRERLAVELEGDRHVRARRLAVLFLASLATAQYLAIAEFGKIET